jgi:predicted transcriptional regulator
MHLRFEAGSRAGLAKVDWPRQARGMTDYPQTEEGKTYPSDLEISINGQLVGSVHLADDPCDARGALSHFRDHDPGSYGYLVELDVEGADLEAVRQTLGAARSLQLRFEIPADAVCRGGLSLYGETLGAYPVDPMLRLGVG